MESASNKTNFLSQMNSSFGSGGMSLAMKDIQFVGFILHLKWDQQGLPIRRAASVIGKQPCSDVWVLGEELQVSNYRLTEEYIHYLEYYPIIPFQSILNSR